jgi:hypothetical protein
MPRGIDRYEEALLQGRLFDPRHDPSLAGWYDIGDLSTLSVSSAGTVSAIRDKSFAGRHAAIGGATAGGVNVPLTMQGGPFKNRPALLCTATTGHYFTIASPLSYDATAGRTIIAVVERSSSATIRTVFSTTSNRAMQLRWSTAHELNLTNASWLNIGTLTPAASLGHHIVGAVYSSTGIVANLNGVTQTFAADADLLNANNIILANASGPTEYFHGEFLELMHFSTKLSTERYNRIVGYLAWKHGLQSGLYGTVPYRNNPPLM